MKTLLTLIAFLILPGCSFIPFFGFDSVEPIAVQTVEADRTALNLDLPTPVTPGHIRWKVITPDNIDQIWQELEEKNQSLVLFAITTDGYETLANNLAELRGFVNTQRIIIIKYKEYYEPETLTDQAQNNK